MPFISLHPLISLLDKNTKITNLHSFPSIHSIALSIKQYVGNSFQLLEMCEGVRDRWKPDSLAFIDKALDQLENDYVKYHTYLALGLHSAVQHKDADYRKSEICYALMQYVVPIESRAVDYHSDSRRANAKRLEELVARIAAGEPGKS